jgi:urease accessory protein
MRKTLLAAALILASAPAMAHTGHGGSDGLVPGLLHPVLGADHLLAMLAVGLWSGFVLPRRIWSGAAVFLAAMTGGAGLAWAGVGVPGIETMILASVVAFGALVAVSRRDQARRLTGVSLAAIAVFAASHGYAHASEATGAAALYLCGFLISTAALHAAGILFARTVGGQLGLQRVLGGAIVASGLLLIAG